MLYVMLDKTWTPHSTPEMTNATILFTIGEDLYFTCFDDKEKTIAETAQALVDRMGVSHMWESQKQEIGKQNV